ncbi:MAG: hypothetical protein LBV08_01510 [Clostridiales bacterium]|jgi:uncharacterized membrane protein|nr:hypothetical protein [Clostridiales bacterium]
MKGIKESHLCVLAYLGFFVTGFILLIVEKGSLRVRFHAMQSFIYFLGLFLISALFGLVPFFGGIIQFLIGILTMVSYLYLIYITYKDVDFRIPYIGDAINDYINK